MTPLAHGMMRARLANDFGKLISDVPHQRFPDPYQHLKDVHFFDVSEVIELATSMTTNSIVSAVQVLAFLPAPKTWIECRIRNTNARWAFLLTEIEGNLAQVEMFVGSGTGMTVSRGPGLKLPLVGRSDMLTKQAYITPGSWAAEKDCLHGTAVAGTLYMFLALINSPKLIGQRIHQPHRGLERALLKDRDFAAGKFPFHAWKEIKLEVRPPKQADGEQEAHFTGRRAYHFVRQYLRMQGGQLVLVSSHWKGDPALGIERSRYTVVPGQQAA